MMLPLEIFSSPDGGTSAATITFRTSDQHTAWVWHAFRTIQSLCRAPVHRGLEERRGFPQGVGIVAGQGVTAGWKNNGSAIGNSAGNEFRAAGRAEPIVFRADGQDRAGDLFDWIRLARGGGLDVELHSSVAAAYRQEMIENLLDSRLLARVGGAQDGGVGAEDRLGQCARHDRHEFHGRPSGEVGVEHHAGQGTAVNGCPWRQVVSGNQQNQGTAALRVTDGELYARPSARGDAGDADFVDPQTIEELGVGIGLHRGADLGGQSGSKIAEAGWSDKSI